MRMSVEGPLWRALVAYRVLTCAYAIAVFVYAYDDLKHPLIGGIYLGVLGVWTLSTLGRVRSAERCTRGFLAIDLTLALLGILLTMVVDTHARIEEGAFTLPSIWTAGSVLAFAVKGGWRWAAVASSLVAVADLVERGSGAGRDTLRNVLLVWVASIGIGYVVEVARISERTLARALQIEAATRERERLARDIHDGVLQVLAMVQRRGDQAGGEAAELGRMAGEQEVALRGLISGAPVPAPRTGEEPAGPPGPADLRALLAPYASARVTLSAPGTPVTVEPAAGAELAAAVGAALDNVAVHAGDGARAWILVEDEPDALLVTVRDDGPGIPEGRLDAAAAEGRLGAAQSIRGRLRDLGGSAQWLSLPGEGTEVELRLPKARQKAGTSGGGTG
ncbi:MacS family sensor histidine kinase [Streptomyces sp. NPDC004031]